MKQSEYMELLTAELNGIDEIKAQELIDDVSAHFAEGLESGRTEEEICEELGDARLLAGEAVSFIGESMEANTVYTEDEEPQRVRVDICPAENETGSTESGTGSAEVKTGSGEKRTDSAESIAVRDTAGRIERVIKGADRVELKAEFADAEIRSGSGSEVRVICESEDPENLSRFYCELSDGVLRTGIRKKSDFSFLERLFSRSDVRICLTVPDNLKGGALFSSSSGDMDAELLRMPVLEFSTASGDVNARFTGSRRLSLHSASGDVRLEGTHAEYLEAGSASGDMILEDVKAGSAKLSSASGDLTVHGGSVRELVCRSASGDIELSGNVPFVRGETASGDIEISSGCAVETQLKLVSGDARLYSGEAISGSVSTVSGDVNLDTSGLKRGLAVEYTTIGGEQSVRCSCESESRRRGGSAFIRGTDGGTREDAGRLTVKTTSGDLMIR